MPKPDSGRKSQYFCLPHLHSTPPLRGIPSEYCHNVWYGKSRIVWLPDGEKIEDVITRFDTTHERDRLTDERTDRRMDTIWRHKPRLFVASRGKINVKITFAIASILPRDAMHKRGLCCHAVSVCLSVCPSVRPSVTFVDHVKTNKRSLSSNFFSPSGSDTILVFPYQRGCRHSDPTGTPLTGASNARGV